MNPGLYGAQRAVHGLGDLNVRKLSLVEQPEGLPIFGPQGGKGQLDFLGQVLGFGNFQGIVA